MSCKSYISYWYYILFVNLIYLTDIIYLRCLELLIEAEEACSLGSSSSIASSKRSNRKSNKNSPSSRKNKANRSSKGMVSSQSQPLSPLAVANAGSTSSIFSPTGGAAISTVSSAVVSDGSLDQAANNLDEFVTHTSSDLHRLQSGPYTSNKT